MTKTTKTFLILFFSSVINFFFSLFKTILNTDSDSDCGLYNYSIFKYISVYSSRYIFLIVNLFA